MSAAREWSIDRYPFNADEAQEARGMLLRVLAYRAPATEPELRRRITELEQQVLKLRAELRSTRWELLAKKVGVDRG